MLVQNSTDLFRTQGLSGLGRVAQTQRQDHREAEPRTLGRSLGSSRIFENRAEFLQKYREFQKQSLRQPLEKEFALFVGMGKRTVGTYLARYKLRWPPE
jgi:hypothetical protein